MEKCTCLSGFARPFLIAVCLAAGFLGTSCRTLADDKSGPSPVELVEIRDRIDTLREEIIANHLASVDEEEKALYLSLLDEIGRFRNQKFAEVKSLPSPGNLAVSASIQAPSPRCRRCGSEE